jgi:hypothetical protein
MWEVWVVDEGGKRAWGSGKRKAEMGQWGKGEMGNGAMGEGRSRGDDLLHYYAYFVFHLLEYGVVHAGSFFVCYFCFFDPSSQEYAPTGSIEAEMRKKKKQRKRK